MRRRWEEIIVGDLFATPAPNDPDGTCSRGMPEEIDDVYVCAKFTSLDGEFGTLGAAGPRFIRSNYLHSVLHFVVEKRMASASCSKMARESL